MPLWRDPWNNLRIGPLYLAGIGEFLLVTYVIVVNIVALGLLGFWLSVLGRP